MPSWLSVALIPLCAFVFGVLGFLAVAFVEFLGDQEENFVKYLRRSESPGPYTRSNWKPLSGGICAAVLAGGSAAEFTSPSFAKSAEGHPVLTSALTGALLAIITVLVIETLVRSLASRAWRSSLTDTWRLAVRGGRRGGTDLRRHLLGTDPRVTARCLPKPEEAQQAHRRAHELWVDLGDRVARASLAAFASDTPDLGEAMHELSTATDTLHRALQRYSSREPSDTKGDLYTEQEIVDYWRDYVLCLLEVDKQGHALTNYSSPVSATQRQWLEAESEGHIPTTAR